MGDADLARGQGMQPEEVAEAINNLEEEVNYLQGTVTNLDLRIYHELNRQMKAYLTFRCFVIAINFVFIPVLMAVGLSYILKELIEVEPQDPLHGIIEVLWFIAGCLGAPLYLGSIWAIYNLPVPEEMPDDEFFGIMIGELDFNEPVDGMEPDENDTIENGSEEDVNNETMENRGEEDVSNETMENWLEEDDDNETSVKRMGSDENDPIENGWEEDVNNETMENQGEEDDNNEMFEIQQQEHANQEILETQRHEGDRDEAHNEEDSENVDLLQGHAFNETELQP